ncbi:hypothetical protein KA001_01585 [Patescibacteria group bacterium]|nr:hypothetical protein [Patescibacteria group bacterium]
MIKNIEKFHVYKNIILFLSCVAVGYLIFKNQAAHSFLLHLGNFGYLGVFLAGFMFVSTFTLVPGTILLTFFSEYIPLYEVLIVGALGATTFDFLAFLFIKNKVSEEVNIFIKIFNKKSYFRKVISSHYFSWMLPIIGAIILASPIPDEIGISMLGISNMSKIKFVVLSFVLNSIGIFVVIEGLTILKNL